MNNWTGALKAESIKVLRNYKFNAFLVWILPIGMLAFNLIMIVGGLLLNAPPEELIYGCGGQWTENVYGIWNFLIAFPGSIFGRILPLAFFAVVFAGEYQWGTWKNIAPRNNRLILLISKGTVATLTVVTSILITAPISAGGQSILCKIGGTFYGPAISAAVLGDFLGKFLLKSLIGLSVLLMILGFAALASILSRSVLGGFLGGFGFSLVELFSLGILILLGNILNKPDLVNFYRFMPGYNIENLQSWFFHGVGYGGELLGMAVEIPQWQSLAVMAAWIIIPFAIAIYAFRRQDIT
jgi:ABC-type transport system involved in multi-copper enzyme maturation permease subunit